MLLWNDTKILKNKETWLAMLANDSTNLVNIADFFNVFFSFRSGQANIRHQRCYVSYLGEKWDIFSCLNLLVDATIFWTSSTNYYSFLYIRIPKNVIRLGYAMHIFEIKMFSTAAIFIYFLIYL